MRAAAAITENKPHQPREFFEDFLPNVTLDSGMALEFLCRASARPPDITHVSIRGALFLGGRPPESK